MWTWVKSERVQQPINFHNEKCSTFVYGIHFMWCLCLLMSFCNRNEFIFEWVKWVSVAAAACSIKNDRKRRRRRRRIRRRRRMRETPLYMRAHTHSCVWSLMTDHKLSAHIIMHAHSHEDEQRTRRALTRTHAYSSRYLWVTLLLCCAVICIFSLVMVACACLNIVRMISRVRLWVRMEKEILSSNRIVQRHGMR